MFNKEFDIVLSNKAPIEETINSLKSIGVDIDEVNVKWVKDPCDVFINTVLIFSGVGSIREIKKLFRKSTFKHYVINGKHTFM